MIHWIAIMTFECLFPSIEFSLLRCRQMPLLLFFSWVRFAFSVTQSLDAMATYTASDSCRLPFTSNSPSTHRPHVLRSVSCDLNFSRSTGGDRYMAHESAASPRVAGNNLCARALVLPLNSLGVLYFEHSLLCNLCTVWHQRVVWQSLDTDQCVHVSHTQIIGPKP